MNYPVGSASRTSSLAIASLIFGVLSWCVLPVVGAVVAIVCGHLARGEMRHPPQGVVIEGNGLAVSGQVLGYLNIVAGVLFVLALLGVLFLGAGLFHWWG
jgi:cytochrome c biogenesis protein CcdA